MTKLRAADSNSSVALGAKLLGANALGNSAIVSVTIGYSEIKEALERLEAAFEASHLLAGDTLEYKVPDDMPDQRQSDDEPVGSGEDDDGEFVFEEVVDALSEQGFFAGIATLDDPASFSSSMSVVISHFTRPSCIWLIQEYMASIGRHLRHETLMNCHRLGIIPHQDMTDEIRLLAADGHTAWEVIRECEGDQVGEFIGEDGSIEAQSLINRLAARVENMNAYTDYLLSLDEMMMRKTTAD